MMTVAVLEMEGCEAVGWFIGQWVSSDDSSWVRVQEGEGYIWVN